MKRDSIEIVVVLQTLRDVLKDAAEARSGERFDELIAQAAIAIKLIERLRGKP